MAGRVADGPAGSSGLAGYVSVGLGQSNQAPGGSAYHWTWGIFLAALAFLIIVHFRIGFSPEG